MPSKQHFFSGRIQSIRHALSGIWTMLRSQHNARIHAAASVAVVAAGLVLGVAPLEWCLLALAIMAVWVSEGLNTAFELLADVASPEFHPRVKQAKDVAAGAVLIAAVTALIIGAFVLGPRLLHLVSGMMR